MRNFPGPGIEHMSPALTGIFLMTGPPGKHDFFKFFNKKLIILLCSSPWTVCLFGDGSSALTEIMRALSKALQVGSADPT